VDFDQVVDNYGEMFGVDPKVLVPDDQVAQIRAQRAQAMQAQQAAAAAPAVVDAAKTASDIDTGNMRDVLGMFAGYNSPTSTEMIG